MSNAQLFTLGYEGLDIESFVEKLQAAGVQTLIDVREVPQSRKKGFSKNGLRERLAQSGLDYVHVKSLGCPKPIRDAEKKDGGWNAYTEKFNEYLQTQGDAVHDLWELAKHRSSCLMCFEHDHMACHRTCVANAAKELGAIEVTHLGE